MRSRATRQIRCVNMSLINLHDIYSQIFLRNSICVATEFRCGDAGTIEILGMHKPLLVKLETSHIVSNIRI